MTNTQEEYRSPRISFNYQTPNVRDAIIDDVDPGDIELEDDQVDDSRAYNGTSQELDLEVLFQLPSATEYVSKYSERTSLVKGLMNEFGDNQKSRQTVNRIVTNNLVYLGAGRDIEAYMRRVHEIPLLPFDITAHAFKDLECGVELYKQILEERKESDKQSVQSQAEKPNDQSVDEIDKPYPDISAEEKKILVDAAAARQRLVVSNLRLVFGYAAHKSYSGKLPYEDLVGAGIAGLFKAVDYFDFRKGYAFSTYASWWIKRSMYRASLDNLPVHMTDYAFNRVTKVKKAASSLEKVLGAKPTNAEIAAATGIGEKLIPRILGHAVMISQVVELDKPFDTSATGSNKTYSDIIGTGNDIYSRVDDLMDGKALTDWICEHSGLPLRAQYILFARCGIVAEQLKGTSIETKDSVVTYEEFCQKLAGTDQSSTKQLADVLGMVRQGIDYIQNSVITPQLKKLLAHEQSKFL